MRDGGIAAPAYRPDYNVPDRLLALSSVKELRQGRKWQLILVNVEAAEAGRIREEHFRHLVYPLRTVLDDSIGCALWFAARGEGLLHHSGPREGKGGASNPISCVSSAKVSLLLHTCTDTHHTHAHAHTHMHKHMRIHYTHSRVLCHVSSHARHYWWALAQMNSWPATPDTDRGSSMAVGKGLLKRWIWMSSEFHLATLVETTGRCSREGLSSFDVCMYVRTYVSMALTVRPSSSGALEITDVRHAFHFWTKM